MDVYKEQIEIASTDVDFNLECKLSALFLYFQDIATAHSNLLGTGRKNTTEKGLHWVITRFDVVIKRMPKYGEEVTLATYPGDSNPIFYLRQFYIEDKNHNIIVRANSLWTILDATTHKVVKDAFNGRELPKIHLPNELPNPQKISLREGDLIYSKTIRYSDIDLNGHLNNTRYIELIQDAFDLSFYKEYKIKSFSINYTKELKANDIIDIFTSVDNNYIVYGKKDDNIHYISEISFEKR